MIIILRDTLVVLTLIWVTRTGRCEAILLNRHLWPSRALKPAYERFLNEQCGSVSGRENLASLLVSETRFCEKYHVNQGCDWCAMGKILHDCLRNRQHLEKVVERYIDFDGNRRISDHERSAITIRARGRHGRKYLGNVRWAHLFALGPRIANI